MLCIVISSIYSGTAATTMLHIGQTEGYPGLAYIATSYMAMKHFNNRDPTVIPELAELEDCTVKLDFNRTLFIDTESITHLAAQSFLKVQEKGLPSAMTGTFNVLPADDISVMANAAKVPFVASGAEMSNVFGTKFDPYTTRMYPNTEASAEALYSFLLSVGRSNYITYLYAINQVNLHRQERLSHVFDAAGVSHYVQSFLNSESKSSGGIRSVKQALQSAKDRGYRTIVVSPDAASIECPELAAAAEELGMNNGDYFWAWYGNLELGFINRKAPYVDKLLEGSAWVVPVARQAYENKDNNFLQSWRSFDAEEVDKVNRATPLEKDSVAYSQLPVDYFQKYAPEYGTGFMYDSVMAVGFGACLAEQMKGGTNHENMRVSIRSANFSGTTGTVAFGSDDKPGSRVVSTFIWGVFNIIQLPTKEGDKFVYKMARVRESLNSSWKEIVPFVFANNSKSPPALLRDPTEQNYLSKGIRIVGLAMMSFVMLLCLVSSILVVYYRKNKVIRAAQPIFMHLLAFGCFVSVSAILPLSYDESYGFTEDQLSMACMSVPWLATYGIVISKYQLDLSEVVSNCIASYIVVWHYLYHAGSILCN
jgi:Receptor family ligand binding region